MKALLKLEEALMFLIASALAYQLPYPFWYYWAWFLSPDLGMLGYVANPRIGAFTYNLLHHKGIAIALYLAGLYYASHVLQFAGLVMFGHASFDRMLGYGLKFTDSFHNTHLGRIGRAQ